MGKMSSPLLVSAVTPSGLVLEEVEIEESCCCCFVEEENCLRSSWEN